MKLYYAPGTISLMPHVALLESGLFSTRSRLVRPAFTALCATPRELNAPAWVAILPARGAAILGTSVLLHSGQDEEHGGQL